MTRNSCSTASAPNMASAATIADTSDAVCSLNTPSVDEGSGSPAAPVTWRIFSSGTPERSTGSATVIAGPPRIITTATCTGSSSRYATRSSGPAAMPA